eukprot:scaffold320_cov367-Pinguiococcus_pyrenoidosus.AAC.9
MLSQYPCCANAVLPQKSSTWIIGCEASVSVPIGQVVPSEISDPSARLPSPGRRRSCVVSTDLSLKASRIRRFYAPANQSRRRWTSNRLPRCQGTVHRFPRGPISSAHHRSRVTPRLQTRPLPRLGFGDSPIKRCAPADPTDERSRDWRVRLSPQVARIVLRLRPPSPSPISKSRNPRTSISIWPTTDVL